MAGSVLCLFLVVLWVGLKYFILAVSGYTHIFCYESCVISANVSLKFEFSIRVGSLALSNVWVLKGTIN